MDISSVENLVIGFLKRLQAHEGAPLLGLLSVESRIRILKAIWDCDERPANSRIKYDSSESWGPQVAPMILDFCSDAVKVKTLDGIKNPDFLHLLRQQVRLFSDIINIDHRLIQRILPKIDHKELALALSDRPEDFCDAVLSNLSGFNRQVVIDEIGYLKDVEQEDVDDVREAIIAVWRSVEAASIDDESN